MEMTTNEKRSYFSKIGFWCLGMILLCNVGVVFLQAVLAHFVPVLSDETQAGMWFGYVLKHGSELLMIFAAAKLLPPLVPVSKEKKLLSVPQFIAAYLMAYAMVNCMHLVGMVFEKIFSLFRDNHVDMVTDMVFSGNEGMALMVISTAILAPIFEELLMRKVLIDRMRPFGEWVCVLMSGLIFGLLHGNITQLLYTMVLGFLLAFVYLKTNRIINCILLHILNNLTSILFVVLGIDLMIMIGYMAIATVAGLILLLVNRKKFRLEPSDVIPKGERMKVLFLSPGMLSLMVLFALYFVITNFVI